MDNQTDILWHGWKTVREIGRGSFGAVYEIERELFDKKEKAALKHISIPKSGSDIEELYCNGYDDASITAHFKSYLADIVREYSLMVEIKGHTNVVYCDDIRYIQRDDGFGWDIYIKMELLTPMMKQLDKIVSDESIIKFTKDLCNALILCEDKQIIHRDIKPQNIFVSDRGDYKLGDFGVARTMDHATQATMNMGTYAYMAPEVHNGQPYNHTVDIYSLGMVLYWLLNEHRLPFLPLPPKAPTSEEVRIAQADRFAGKPIPTPKNGSAALKAIALKACAFDPKERYQNAHQMLADLNAIAPAAKPAPVDVVVPVAPVQPVVTAQPVVENAVEEMDDHTVRLKWAVEAQQAANAAASAQAAAQNAAVQPVNEDMDHTVRMAPTPKQAAPVAQTPQQPVNQNRQAQNRAGQKGAKEEKRKKKRIWPFLLVLEILAIGVLIFLLLRSCDSGFLADLTKDPTDKPGTTTTTSTNDSTRPNTKPTGTTGNTETTEPNGTTESTEPNGTTQPTDSTEPTQPTEPTKPTEPTQPTEPSVPPTTMPDDVVLVSITIQSKPGTLNYYVGDKLDTKGLKLKATYSNNTTQIITSGFSCSPTTLNKAGTQTITVTYQGKTAQFTVNVLAVKLQSITVKKPPNTVIYIVGDKLDTRGLTLTATYNNGTTETITSGFTCSPTTLSKVGTQSITVIYQGKSAKFDVQVNAKLELEPSELTITDFSKVYFLNTGSIKASDITWSSSNTNVAVVNSVGGVIAKSDGTATITATYRGQKATCIVHCKGASYEVASGTCGSNAKWSLNSNGVLTISGSGKMTDYASEKDVPWREYRADISQIVISNGITSVGDCAFYGCSAVSVQMANSVTTIGRESFSQCTKLSNVQLSNNLEKVARKAFMSCKSLTSIKLPQSVAYIEKWAFEDCSSLNSVYIYNPNCELDSTSPFDHPSENPNLTIYCYDGPVKQWAVNHGYTYVRLQ